MNDRAKQQTSDALDWLYAHCMRLDVAIREWKPGEARDLRQVWISPDTDRGKHLHDLDREGVGRKLSMMCAANSHKSDIYMRPTREVATMVLLDDLSPDFAYRLCRKYATLAVETSPGSAQAWVALGRVVTPEERHLIQKEMIRRLCEDGRQGADPAASSGTQIGRLPGFKNHKPEYGDHPPWVNVLAATDGNPLDADDLLGSIAADAPAAAVPQLRRTGRATGIGDGSASGDDWAWAKRARATGRSWEKIRAHLVSSALARGKNGGTLRAAEDYADLTIRNLKKLGL